MKDRKAPRWLMISAFAAIYFAWGTTYLANLFALKGLEPFTISCFRYLVAGIILSVWIKFRKLPLPGKKSIKVLCISGIMMLVGGSGLIVFAEKYISSGYAAVIVATEPLWFVLLDKKRWKLYFSNRLVIAGLAIGYTGIFLFACMGSGHAAADGSRAHLIMGTIIVIISAILWVAGTLYANRKLPAEGSNTTNTAVQLIAAGIFSSVIALGTGEWHRLSLPAVSPEAWGGLWFLIIVGSLVAYSAFTWLITVQPPAIVSTHTYVNPVVAILMGWLIADEHISARQIIALIVIFAGVVLTQVGKNRSARR